MIQCAKCVKMTFLAKEKTNMRRMVRACHVSSNITVRNVNKKSHSDLSRLPRGNNNYFFFSLWAKHTVAS